MRTNMSTAAALAPHADRAAVLVVEDDPDDQIALEATLVPMGCEVVHAADGVEALKLLLQRDFALIVMDLMMPRMNGFETAALIRQRDRSHDLPIVILSGFDREGMRMLPGYTTAGLEFLQKPVPADALRAKVLECLARDEARRA